MLNIVLVALCIWFSYTDIKARIIPNRITHPLIIALLLIRLFEPAYFLGLIPALILLICFFIRPNSIGAGDIKFLAIIGLCIGIQGTALVILLTCASTLIFLMVWKQVGRIFGFEKIKTVPLAPFLSFGVLVSLIYKFLGLTIY
ncbi:prepilin peptidase [Paenibacillus lautus]|uniref:prepilin peptidase n=1 Tax=Paenibacillus lautus TaxID=1401 RepID=UPI003D2A42B2